MTYEAKQPGSGHHPERQERAAGPGSPPVSQTPVKPERSERTERSERPASHDRTERAHLPGKAARPTHHEPDARSTPEQLFAQAEREKLALRLQQSLTAFVDGPRHAVEEASAVLEEAAEQITAALTERRHTLRAAWHTEREGRSAETDTEELRVTLRAYREVTERLLRL
ncbi:hypothetical protein [Streptomyces sp. NBC_00829]|uniref:hypothetical protein n=1 Tax=Streptomyces sp. NBC_00829 TaxID=2903679 RepID=UPI003870A314|nr:hypothetical protein OG293_34040 [Streptomyces sp. NBC_00829]